MILARGRDRHTVELEAADTAGHVRVRIDGQAVDLSLEPLAPEIHRVRVGEATHTLHCVVEGDDIHFFWQGRAYRVRREAAAGARVADPGALEAPMPGTVTLVHVAAGDAVAQNQPLLVIEAMKMENVIRAPHAGRVKKLEVARGERVTPGRVLLELE